MSASSCLLLEQRPGSLVPISKGSLPCGQEEPRCEAPGRDLRVGPGSVCHARLLPEVSGDPGAGGRGRGGQTLTDSLALPGGRARRHRRRLEIKGVGVMSPPLADNDRSRQSDSDGHAESLGV